MQKMGWVLLAIVVLLILSLGDDEYFDPPSHV